MARKIIVVTAAYGNDHVKSLGGQAAVLPFIANAGADGVEIRQRGQSVELFRAAQLAADFDAVRAGVGDKRQDGGLPA